MKSIENYEKYIISYKDLNYSGLKYIKDIENTFNSNNYVSFLGAGISKPLGINTWEDLLIKINDDISKKYNIPSLLDKKLVPEKYPDYAQTLFNKDQKLFDEILKNELRHKNNSTSITILQLIRKINIHLTTNFDKTIENAYNFLNSIRVEYSKDKLVYDSIYYPVFVYSLNKKKKIYHLHNNENYSDYVFTKEQYTKAYSKNTFIKRIIEKYYHEKSIIFIGLSFDDQYIKRIFNANYSKDKNHYALISKELIENKIEALIKRETEEEFNNIPDLNNKTKEEKEELYRRIYQRKINEEYKEFEKQTFENVIDLFNQLNIKPIIYTDHIFVEYFFESIAEVGNANRIDGGDLPSE